MPAMSAPRGGAKEALACLPASPRAAPLALPRRLSLLPVSPREGAGPPGSIFASPEGFQLFRLIFLVKGPGASVLNATTHVKQRSVNTISATDSHDLHGLGLLDGLGVRPHHQDLVHAHVLLALAKIHSYLRELLPGRDTEHSPAQPLLHVGEELQHTRVGFGDLVELLQSHVVRVELLDSFMSSVREKENETVWGQDMLRN